MLAAARGGWASMVLMSIRSSVRALEAYRFTPRPEAIKLDQNESFDDLPISLKQRVLAEFATLAWNRYPPLTPQPLERRLAEKHGWDPDGVVVSNGSNVLIQAITVVAGVGRRVVTVAPTFSVYAYQARLLAAELVELPLEADFGLPMARLKQAVSAGPGALFIANPAAPSGNLHPEAEIRELLDHAGGMLAVIDEAYADFAPNDLSPLVERYPNAVSLRTFSKAFGAAGVRVGYALTSPETAIELRKALLPFSVSTLQATVAMALLDEPQLVDERLALVRSERERLQRAMQQLDGVTVHPSVTNFILFRVADPAAVTEQLLDSGVVIRRQDHLPGAEGCLRVSVGFPAENEAFLAALASAQAALGRPDTAIGGRP